MSTSTTAFSSLQLLTVGIRSLLRQSNAPTPNPIVNSIQLCRNAMAMRGVLSSTERAIPNHQEIKDSSIQRENSITSQFNGENANTINEIDMEQLFRDIDAQDLFLTKHHRNKFWLIERVLCSKASKAIDNLINMGSISYYLKTHYVETPSKARKIIYVLSSCHATAIAKLRPCDWKTLAQTTAEQRKAFEPLSPETINQMPLKAIRLIPSFIAEKTCEKEEKAAEKIIDPQRLELLKSCCKAPKIYLKLSKNLFSQWPPAEKFAPTPAKQAEQLAPTAPNNKRRRLTKGT